MDDLIVYDCEQNSPEWCEARRGIITASAFAHVRAKGRSGEDSKTRKKYMRELAAEILTGRPTVLHINAHGRRGHAVEDDARRLYAFLRDKEPVRVGFMRRGRVGASPDSLVDDDGLLEIKSKLPDLQLEVLELDRVPPEHVAQVQGQLWVTGRDWCDFISYCDGLPPFIRRVYRDPDYIADLAVAVDQFIQELDELVEKYREAA